jgi:hypothetical protein
MILYAPALKITKSEEKLVGIHIHEYVHGIINNPEQCCFSVVLSTY